MPHKLLARLTDGMVKVCKEIGLSNDADKLELQAEKIASAFQPTHLGDKTIQREIGRGATQRGPAFQNTYFADIWQAHQDWKSGDVFRLLSALQRYAPTNDVNDIRGWEWHYLLSLVNQEEKTILDFEGIAKQLAWSADETRLFSSRTDDVLRIWDVDGKLIREQQLPGLEQFALHPKATQFATVCGDDTLRVLENHVRQVAPRDSRYRFGSVQCRLGESAEPCGCGGWTNRQEAVGRDFRT